jgi:ATP-binding cassette, subfamily B, bacterial
VAIKAGARPSSVGIITEIAAVHPHRIRATVTLTVLATLAAILEAAALVALAQGALALINDATTDFHGVRLSPPQLLGAAVVILLTTIAIHGLLAKQSASMGFVVLNQVRARALSAYRMASWEAQSSQRAGSLQENVSELSTRTSQSMHIIVDIAVAVVMTLAIAVVAIAVAPIVSLIVLSALIPTTLALRPMTRAARRKSTVSTAATTEFAEEVTATAAVAKELRSFGVEPEQYVLLERAARSAAIDRSRARFANRFADYLFRDITLLILIVMVAALSATVGLQSASTVAALLLIVRSFTYAHVAYGTYQNLMESAAGAELLFERIRVLEAASVPTGRLPLALIRRIELRAVSYRYDPTRPALQAIDLDIEANRTVGLIGKSGAGKSTLAEILLRLRQPTTGTMRVDGLPAQQFDPRDWSRLVAYVPQDPQLWERSVFDNVTFLRPGFDRPQVVEALRAAHVWDTVEALPDGLDTMLGPRNTGLSGGQRQRIAIARALLGAPQVLVLDEPSSALDTTSEQLLQQTLRSLHGQITMVIIAHRMSTLELCDQIIQLDEGRVVATGTWDHFANAESSLLPATPA